MTEKRYSLGRFGCYRTRIVIDNKNGDELGNSIVIKRLNQLEEENKELKKRDDLVSSYLQDEGSITLEKYEEIVDYIYKEWKKKRDFE